MLATAEGVAGITAGATLLAGLGLACVTIYTTTQRLSADADRQKRELAARSEGQRRQLQHARELADLADLRKLLDEAATALSKARITTEKGTERVSLASAESVTKEIKQRFVEETSDGITESEPLLVELTARLRVRLGPNDPITATFGEASGAVRELGRLAVGLRIGVRNAVPERADAARRTFTASERVFIEAAVERAGTVAIGEDEAVLKRASRAPVRL